MRPEVDQRRARVERVGGRARRLLREDDLPAVGGRHQPRATVERRPEVVRAAPLDRTGVQAHPHLELAERAQSSSTSATLRSAAASTAPGGIREGGVDRVSDRLEDDAAARLDRPREQIVVPRDRRP